MPAHSIRQMAPDFVLIFDANYANITDMKTQKGILGAVVLAGLLSFSFSTSFAQGVGPFEWTRGLSLVLLSTNDAQSQVALRDAAERAGGRVGLIFPPKVLIGWFSQEAEQSIVMIPGVRGLYRSYVEPSSLGSMDEATLQAVQFFNSAVSGELERQLAGERRAQKGDPLMDDALPHPDVNYNDYIENLRGGFSGDIPRDLEEILGRMPLEVQGNSDNMVGTVTVTIFFVESNGSIDPNTYTWTTTAQNEILNKAASGLAWWVSQAGSYGKSLSFTIRNYPGSDVRCQTGYEPIIHPSTDAPLWVSQIMANFGYSSGSHISRVTAYNTWAKANYGTDWAYSAFVEYNPPPAADRFTNGYAAWAYLGGPYTNLLYRSFGWGFDIVFPHETGHIFWACDEYYEPGYGGCTSCGICSHGVINGNCEYCNPQSVPCMMKANSPYLCVYTPGQIGWFTTPLLQHFSHTIFDPLGNGNGIAEPGETVSMDVTLKNYGFEATGISATLSTSDSYITITSNSSTYPNIPLAGTGSSITDYVFSSLPGTPVGHLTNFILTIHATGYDVLDTFSVYIGETPVLLVDDDGGATYETYYQTAIASTGLNYLRWNVKTQGSPSLTELRKHRATVWFTSLETEFTLNGEDERNLTSYLNSGGTLLFSSQDYLFERFETFAKDILRVNDFTPDVNSSSETGVSGDPISSGMSLTMSYPFYNYSDDIVPGLNASRVFTNSTGNPGAIRFPSRGTAPYKAVFMAFPFEAISNQAAPNNRNTVMDRILDWLLLPQDYQPPVVSLISPNGNESWEAGTTHEIRWAASDSSGVDSIAIFCSVDGGFTYPDTITTSTPNDSSFMWVVPNSPSDSVLIKVVAYDRWLNTASDVSDGLFTIFAPDTIPPDVLVISPNGGEEWTVAEQDTIKWTATDASGVDSVSIYYSINSGASYPYLIAHGLPNSSSYVWTIPDTPSDSCRVKVVAYAEDDPPGYDESDTLFRIKYQIAVLDNPGNLIPARFYLAQNHPNPFNPVTGISFGLPAPAHVSLKIYSVSGKLISSLVEANLGAGVHDLTWDGRDDAGRVLASGIYLLKLHAGVFTETRKMVLLR
ncbi:MAG: FlgD immunoglobulin-like domain containing protein [Candidatus Eisenbacteria bacterium]|nr:FlgD immunoglobulin-like domain containing protein [Candidatus Eisenbacteria bacterium]